MQNLTKKQKFIILVIIGSILIIGAFIWSMVLDLSQVSISNPIPEINLPKFPELTDEIESNNSSDTTELQEIAEILEQEQSKDKSLEQEKNSSDSNRVNTDIDLDQKQE